MSSAGENMKRREDPRGLERRIKYQETEETDLSSYNNWRGFTLLSIPSKILTRTILNRIRNTAEQHLRKDQAGFRKHRSCVDLINTFRIILEQSVDGRPFYMRPLSIWKGI